jgi:hypothetical protein
MTVSTWHSDSVPWFIDRIVSKGRSLGALAYKRDVVKIFVADQAAALAWPRGLSLVQKVSYPARGPLYDLMRRAGHWHDAEMERRRAFGDVCYAAYHEGRCVHYSWMTSTTRLLTDAGCTAHLTPQNSWIYNCYTAPEYRGWSIYPIVLAHIVAEVQAQRGGRVWIDVLDGNTASLRGVSKAGFKEVAAMERTVALSHLTVWRRATVVDRTLARILPTFGSDWAGVTS